MKSEKCLNRKNIVWWQRILLLLFTIHFSCIPSIASEQTKVGSWKTYLSYYGVQQIEAAGNDIFVLSSNSLWSYNKNDQSVTTYDNNNGLNDIVITTIAWNKTAKRLLIAYDNCNIDLLDLKGNVSNIPDINLKIITGKKTINSTYINSRFCYLACSFGIVKLDMTNSEISESYMLGFEVNKVTINGNIIYALSADNTIWSCSLDKNLIDKGNWSINTTIDSSIFNSDDTDYQQYYPIVSTLNPNSPKYNYFRFLRFKNNKLYTCNGIMESNFGGVFNPNKTATIQVWDGNNWTIYQDELDDIIGHKYVDLASVDVDPNDPNHVFAGGRIGLYEFRNGKFIKEYNYDNSELVSNVNLDQLNKNYTMVETVVFDKNGSLWLFNSSSDKTSLIEITKEGEWIHHHKKEFLITGGRSFDNVVRATFDSNGLLWLCNNRFIEPALICYNPTTDEAFAYKSFINQDGTPLASVISGVTSVAEDMDGNIWFGTDAGPMMIEKQYIGRNASDIVLTQVKVPRNDGTNYADYLLAGIYISCIKVDNDGKKWFGTNGNGIYVISQDNMTEVEHFTTENSGLISNNIGDIEIDENTGEVFIGTDNGLCSYMSGITKVINEMTKEDVYAYPNPVQPDYTGLITITGLTYNADVKILSSNGALIKEGKSSGRMFTWDGKDKNGNKVASGIYMVATATKDGNQGVVCKIAIIN